MSGSRKYGRTYHYDFSPGTTSDDRINRDWYDHIQRMKKTIDTEKMDGENRGLTGIGMFARSHAAPTTNPWATHLKPKYDMIKNDLKEGNIELFGEDIYAVHSIIYPNIKEHFYVFGVRILDKWLSWEETKWYASIFDFPTVPEITINDVGLMTKENIQAHVINEASKPSVFGSHQVLAKGAMGEPCTREGLVTRNYDEFDVALQHENIFKYVRKGHVSTDEHWTRNWKRAPLEWEKKK
tara:strand:+ start:5993 stop:6709 length:717 start_codon:yes stop_codon:yes gene_type:complete